MTWNPAKCGERLLRGCHLRFVAACMLLVPLATGCSRSHYRLGADDEAYGVLYEKATATPWDLPSGFTIDADPRSRLYETTDPDDPSLPSGPLNLYAYELPPQESAAGESGASEDEPPGAFGGEPPQPAPRRNRGVVLATWVLSEEQDDTQPAPERPGMPAPSAAPRARQGEAGIGTLPILPIPAEYWDAVPAQCLARMIEFESVRREYQEEFDKEPPADLRDPARKLTLHDIIDLAVTNSREYQTQKEQLYLAALALTLERFDYDLKFSSFGNGTDLNYAHSRAGGRTVNTLGIPSSLGVDKMLATGGTLVGRFANDVVLTFNGPEGFASDVSSELLFDFTQSVLQRDILLEPLIQSERDVVYAARAFARFRKTFFFQLASDYYALLRSYRQIEIDAQNYFSLVRALNQAEAEQRTGIQAAPPRFEVEQIEQQMLAGRSDLINTCTDLERSLDRLKVRMGLPPEISLNLDLRELEQLTLRDEIETAGERVNRARRRLLDQRDREAAAMQQITNAAVREIAAQASRSELVNAAVVLAERLLEWLRLQERRGEPVAESRAYEPLHASLRVDEARLDTDRTREELEQARRAVPPAPAVQLFQRTIDLIDALLELVNRQLQLAELLGGRAEEVSDISHKREGFQEQAQQLRVRLATALREARLDELDALLKESEQLLQELEGLVRVGDELIGAPAQRPSAEEELQATIEQINQLLTDSDRLLGEVPTGLIPVDISVDDAMGTALVQRFDLMNQRGMLADNWRDIKLAADELRSVLNLNASQTIGTENNRPFGFTFDESRTALNLSLDLPLNRKAQRNSYRRSLINYQAARRNLTGAEDNVKLAARDGLRDLDLARVQYQISVASAALAAERVLSTRLELALGFAGVQARDFLEAQDAYRAALGRVADNDIGYIVERAQFFLNLELMLLDDTGFWPEIDDERYQPVPDLTPPPGAGPLYGTFPSFLKTSCEIHRMLHVPYPEAPSSNQPAAVPGPEAAEPQAVEMPDPSGTSAAQRGSREPADDEAVRPDERRGDAEQDGAAPAHAGG